MTYDGHNIDSLIWATDQILSGMDPGESRADELGEGRQIQPAALGANPLPEIFYGGFYEGLADCDAVYLTLEPPVYVPGGGHVEVECAGETAIVRVFDAAGQPKETRLQCAIVRDRQEIRIVQAGGCHA
jgi:hypothetical protein